MAWVDVQIFRLLTLQLLLLVVSLAKSPQVCYYARGALASEDIIPCYTTVKGGYDSCCKVGDTCFNHGACVNNEYGLVYQYGCTDPEYEDIHCPRKCYLDTGKSRWVDLIYCGGTGSTVDGWICHHPDNCGLPGDCAKNWHPELESLYSTTCDDISKKLSYDEMESYVAFTAGLSSIAELPDKYALSEWWSEHADRTRTTDSSLPSPFDAMTGTWHSTTSESTTTQRDSTAPPTTPPFLPPSSSEAAPQPNTTKKTTKLRLSISLGLGIPTCLTLAALTLFLLRRRRKSKQKAVLASASTTAHVPPSSDEYLPDKDKPGVHASHAQHLGLNGMPIFQRPASRHPSELPGSPVVALESGTGMEAERAEGREVGGLRDGGQVHELPC